MCWLSRRYFWRAAGLGIYLNITYYILSNLKLLKKLDADVHRGILMLILCIPLYVLLPHTEELWWMCSKDIFWSLISLRTPLGIGVAISALLRSTSSNGGMCQLRLVFEQTAMLQVINLVRMIVTVANTFKGHLAPCGECPPRV